MVFGVARLVLVVDTACEVVVGFATTCLLTTDFVTGAGASFAGAAT